MRLLLVAAGFYHLQRLGGNDLRGARFASQLWRFLGYHRSRRRAVGLDQHQARLLQRSVEVDRCRGRRLRHDDRVRYRRNFRRRNGLWSFRNDRSRCNDGNIGSRRRCYGDGLGQDRFHDRNSHGRLGCGLRRGLDRRRVPACYGRNNCFNRFVGGNCRGGLRN